ncbi:MULTISPECIES: hypothetical protein [unclassified Labrenzia]|uniref:hypothetical protein n=1 Tax=unclassified Labrenzia TaxID=2648686 RepID=UPI00126868DC|nr:MULTISPECIES: hypothetical protein [unclassified Labrenzia]
MWHFPSDKQKPDQQQGNKFASIKAVPVTCAAHESSGGSSDRTAFCNAQGELALGAFVGLSGITRFLAKFSRFYREDANLCDFRARNDFGSPTEIPSANEAAREEILQ